MCVNKDVTVLVQYQDPSNTVNVVFSSSVFYLAVGVVAIVVEAAGGKVIPPKC